MLGTGTVTAFDEDRGLGEVAVDGGEVLPFHCTAVADGSRTVPVGARVAFAVVAGHLGRHEARDLTVLVPATTPSGQPPP